MKPSQISRTEALRQLREIAPIQQENEALKTQLVLLHSELRHQQVAISQLRVLTRQRSERIDELNHKLEQARAANRKLDEENDHLVESVYRWKD